jgi:hypothetical protein
VTARSTGRFVISLFTTMVASWSAAAQVAQGAPASRPDSVVVVPGAGYRAGAINSLLFGEHYRALWTTPLKVPVLRLDTTARGLRVLKRGGSMQTKSLRFAGADGREYVFRSVDKDPTPSLPVELRETYAKQILHDMVSSEHPAAALIVARLLDAAQVLHVTPQLVVLPDDSLLGEYREEFRGTLGMFEIRPTEEDDEGDIPGLAAGTRVLSSEKLLARLRQHSDEHVDARALLAARLLDLFVGDWDRHPDQWRWARESSASSDRWQPIPRDRDWALVRLDGVVWSLARFVYPYPQFVSFERAYPDLVWLTWNARVLDRRFLAVLDKPVWDSIAAGLQARLTDSVIDDAVRRVPPELYAVNGAALTRTLEARRDHLRDVADRFYRLLATEIEIYATEDDEIVTIARADDRFTDIVVRTRKKSGAARAQASYQRRFDARETSEIRIYLSGGDDSVDVRGVPGRTIVRVIAGRGRNTYVDATANTSMRRVIFYDADTLSRVLGTSGDHIDKRQYAPPVTRHGWTDPPRDWGSRWRPYPWFGYSSDAGVFIGGGPLFEHYAFRNTPYASKMTLRVGYATGAGRWRAEYDADFRRTNSLVHLTVFARASELDVVRFFGIGNETTAPGASSFYKIEQKQLALEPMIVASLKWPVTLGVGPIVKRVITSQEATRFVDLAQPYGIGSFGQVGARFRVAADTRDTSENARRGVFVSTQANAYPALWDVRRAFGDVRATASTYITAPTRRSPTLALRVGGDKLWGDYPFYEAAFVGGASTVRGWREQRFAGDASAYGNAELRFSLTRFFFLLPGDLGAFGLADGGRVFRAGEQSDIWHSALGGGLWASFLGRTNTLSASYARSREGGGFYLRSGLLF